MQSTLLFQPIRKFGKSKLLGQQLGQSMMSLAAGEYLVEAGGLSGLQQVDFDVLSVRNRRRSFRFVEAFKPFRQLVDVQPGRLQVNHQKLDLVFVNEMLSASPGSDELESVPGGP